MTKEFDIIQAPIITEKTMNLKETQNKYTFKVLKTANKIEIKNAVEKLYKVTVVEVHTLNVKPRKKRVGKYEGYTSAYKKAICKLKDGDKIAIFEI